MGRTAESQNPLSVEFTPFIEQALANGVILRDETYVPGDDTWFVPYFEGKTTRIVIRKTAAAVEIPVITNISVNPAPTMTFLNPRPATGSLPYPWRWDGGEHNHYIKLPLPLTYEELSQGSQIVVSGITEGLNVIEGVLEENNEIHFRAGGTLIASVVQYNGERDLVQIIVMEEFAGEILAVNFDKAYKNISGQILMDDDEGILYYWENGDTIAKCILNGVVIKTDSNYIPSNGLLGNLVFQSQYIQNYGDVIESYYWTNSRYLYVLRVGTDKKIYAISQVSTNSPLQFPVF